MILCLPVAADEPLVSALDAVHARDFEAALSSLSDLPEAQRTRDTQFHLARVQYLTGDLAASLKTLEALQVSYGKDSEAFYLAGLVYLELVDKVNVFKKVGTAKKSLSSWQDAVAKNPQNLDARYAIFAYYASAPGIAGGDMDRAVNMVQEIDQQDKGYGAMAKGLLLSLQDDSAGAEAAYQEAAILMDRAGPYMSLAQLYMATENYEKALTAAAQFLEGEKRWWDPDITVAYLMRVRANERLGRLQAAKEEAKLALSMNPSKRVEKALKKELKQL